MVWMYWYEPTTVHFSKEEVISRLSICHLTSVTKMPIPKMSTHRLSLRSWVNLVEARHEPVCTFHRSLSLWRRVWCVVSSAALCLHAAQEQCVVTARVITCPVSFTQLAGILALSCIRNWHTVITMSLGLTLRRSMHTLICSSPEHREKCALHAHFCKPWNMKVLRWQVLS